MFYIELKTGFQHDGPAWIARVEVSKSGRTIYFDGRALKRGQGIRGNYFDLESGAEYWISGVKKTGCNRHWGGAGTIDIEEGVVAEYLALRGLSLLPSGLAVVADFPHTTGGTFVRAENKPLLKPRLPPTKGKAQ